MPAWPAGLPQSPSFHDYGRTRKSGLVRTPMDAGPPKSRLRTTADVNVFRAVFRFTAAELATFENFVDADIGRGALAFDFPEPETGVGTISVKIVPQGDDLYALQPHGDGWQVPLTFERLP